MISKKLIFIWALSLFTACSDDDGPYSQEPIKLEDQTNIYPMPPSQWLGGTDPYYTEGYVGDVMPYFDNGKFNLFFLHDAKTKPAGAGFHDIHSFGTSNFTNFKYNGRMIPYGTYDEPDFGVGTGSVAKVGSIYYFYYTGHNGNTPYVQTHPRESVLCATSTDLTNWTKVPNFKLTAPEGYYNYDFRDPHVFFNEEAGEYWMLVSTQTEPERKAVILLFTSDDLQTNDWTAQGPIYATPSGEDFLMLECADMFKMGNYWYLIFSENWSGYKGTRYRMATSPYGPWTGPEIDRFDGEYLYAAKTASDGSNRFLFGWTARKSPENNSGNKEWAGNMVIHQLVQNPDGTLHTKQPGTVRNMFGNIVGTKVESTFGDVTHNEGSVALNISSQCVFERLGPTSQITFDLTMEAGGGTGLILGQDIKTNTGFKIAFEPGNNRIAAYWGISGEEPLVNWVPFSFGEAETHKVLISTNKDVCVVYVDEKMAFSNRIYNIGNKNWSLYTDDNQVLFSNIEVKTP